ncbi:MAG: DUF6665 family protein [Allorhizobium sp.]
MSFRPPASLAPTTGTTLLALDYELAAEKADALGRAGRKAEMALAELSRAKAAGADADVLSALVNTAADLVWALFIQREICGFRSQADAVERYQIPREVLIRVGAGTGRNKAG